MSPSSTAIILDSVDGVPIRQADYDSLFSFVFACGLVFVLTVSFLPQRRLYQDYVRGDRSQMTRERKDLLEDLGFFSSSRPSSQTGPRRSSPDRARPSSQWRERPSSPDRRRPSSRSSSPGRARPSSQWRERFPSPGRARPSSQWRERSLSPSPNSRPRPR